MLTPNVSFEFFPPSSLEASFRLWDTIHDLSPLNPSFVSVTYGAGGATRDLTHDAVKTIASHTGLSVAAHLTCVNATRSETLEIADSYADAGVKDIVALRGDPPAQGKTFTQHPGGFANSIELIEALAARGKCNIHVGAYPDSHPEARDAAANIDWLKRKFDAGASSAITQFFFEAETFLRFRDKCADAGITAPIIPGILPIEDWTKARRFAKRCGAQVPKRLDDTFANAIRDNRHDLLAITQCSTLCTALLENGVEDLHFYTLNKPHLTRVVCHALGLVPQVSLRDVA